VNRNKNVPAALATLVLAGYALAVAAPNPSVSGPVAATAPAGDSSHNYPFFAALEDLKGHGYVEQEFFIEGLANRYKTPEGVTGSVIDGEHRYKTRVIVRRPTSVSRFNGAVVIEWNNVTAGHDMDIDWFQAHDYFIRSGYVYIGVTPQRIGVAALKVWNPERYSSLDVTADGTITDDALSYDIFANVARAVRSPSSPLMSGLKAQLIFATGHSQSASRLAIYVNSVHPLAPVFDAVVVHGGGGKIRTDLRIKVWKLLSETDVINNQAANRQPDSDTFRAWEVAGDSHVDAQFIANRAALVRRDGNPIAPGFTPGGLSSANATAQALALPSATSLCERPPYSHVPFYQVMDAAFEHLQKWAKDGTLPPTAAPIEVTSGGPPAVIARDRAGNSLGGGIRLAEIAVPTGVNTGQNSGAGFCRLYGAHEDFDATTLNDLYPTHAAYVTAVKSITERNVKAGYILRAEGDATIAAAGKSSIGRR
jgi:hypothetical protein